MVAGAARVPDAAGRPRRVSGEPPARTRLSQRGSGMPEAQPRQAMIDRNDAGKGPRLQLRTLGHASIALYRAGETPRLLTDPWLVGSVYWRSWWLQHYPDADELDWLSGAAFVYVTHEHPDHFHTPSLRRLGAGPSYLFPALTEPGYLAYMAENGYRAEVVAPRQWRGIGEGLSILSIPLWNDDSLLLVDTPHALIINLNDAKPPPPVLHAIRRLAERIGKRRVLLSSYSPASLVNSFVDDRGIVSLKPARHYVDYIGRLCDSLGADFYLPFASQAVFHRPDSAWANAYRTTYEDLQRHWSTPTELLPPYTTLDLADFRRTTIAPADYRPIDGPRLAGRTAERIAAEQEATIAADDVSSLEKKLNAFRWLLRAIFRRGFSFKLGERHLFYDVRRGRMHESDSPRGDFVVIVPKATLREALRHNHLSDLGITMFVRIRLLRPIDPRKVYALFVLFQFDDYGHLRSPGALFRWLVRGLAHSVGRRLPLPRLTPR
jgi:hypothetical protein